MLMLWIQSRVDYILNLPQILSKRTTQQQQAQPAFIILQRVWNLQSLNTTWLNNYECGYYVMKWMITIVRVGLKSDCKSRP